MKGVVVVKKLFAFSFAIILAFSTCILVFATEENTEYCEQSDASGVIALPYTVLDLDALRAEREKNAEDVEYSGVNELNPEEFIRLTPTMVDTGLISGTRLEFPGAAPDSVHSDFEENAVTEEGSLTLEIESCTWALEFYQLEIGVYNWEDGTNRYVLLYGGFVSDYSHVFTGLSAGRYSVYIRNRGAEPLSSGYLLYNLY